MVDFLRSGHRIAAKDYQCDSCLGQICNGTRYYHEVHVADGAISSFRCHTDCEDAAKIVFDSTTFWNCEPEHPRVCDLEAEEREVVRTENEALYERIWGS